MRGDNKNRMTSPSRLVTHFLWFPGMKFICNKFPLSNLEIIVKAQRFRISGSQFQKWSFASPKSFRTIEKRAPGRKVRLITNRSRDEVLFASAGNICFTNIKFSLG